MLFDVERTERVKGEVVEFMGIVLAGLRRKSSAKWKWCRRKYIK